MLKWMLQNKELLFAGAGIFVIGLLIDYLQKYFNHKKKTKLTLYLNDKLLKIIVFNFSNWGERVNKEYIGQKISDIILDNLIKYGINVEQSKGIEPKFQIVGTRPPEESAATFYFNENFRKMAPFIFIVGYVKAYEKDRYNIIVRVGRLNTNLKINYVMLKKYKLSSLTPKNIKLKSDKITKDIYTKIKM